MDATDNRIQSVSPRSVTSPFDNVAATIADEWGFTSQKTIDAMIQKQRRLSLMESRARQRALQKDPIERLRNIKRVESKHIPDTKYQWDVGSSGRTGQSPRLPPIDALRSGVMNLSRTSPRLALNIRK
jgi:hypothetical protein